MTRRDDEQFEETLAPMELSNAPITERAAPRHRRSADRLDLGAPGRLAGPGSSLLPNLVNRFSAGC